MACKRSGVRIPVAPLGRGRSVSAESADRSPSLLFARTPSARGGGVAGGTPGGTWGGGRGLAGRTPVGCLGVGGGHREPHICGGASGVRGGDSSAVVLWGHFGVAAPREGDGA